MADKTIQLNIILKAINQTNPAFKGLTGSIAKAEASSMGLGKALLGVGIVAGAAIVGIGVTATKMAADYQQSMLKVQALTGSSDAQMKQYDTGLKQLAVNAGVAPKALADGLYNVLSAGYAGAGAMRVLTLATEDAKIGMTDASTTTNALTNVMANFKVGASGANIVNGEMLKTVTLGKATFSQYATTITKAASTSAQYSQSMETMNAAWATLTASGISAGMATTDYDQSLKVMDGNIGTVTKSLAKNGIAFNESKFNAMDYGHKVVYLNSALQQARDKHVSITGATVQATQAIKTISDHISVYNNDLSMLSNKQAMARQTAQSWATTQGGFNQTMSRLGAAVQVAMINIGSKLLPVLTKAGQQLIPLVSKFMDWANKNHIVDQAASALSATLGGLVTGITNLATWLGNTVSFFQHNQGAMQGLEQGVYALAGAVVAALIPGLVAMAIAAWAAVAPLLPFIAIGALVGLAIYGIVKAVQNWGKIVQWLKGVWGGLSSWFMGLLGGIGNFFHSVFGSIGAWLQGVWSGIKSGATAAWSGIVNYLRQTGQNILNGFLTPFHAIGALFQWLYNHNYYFKALVDTIRNVTSAGLAWLHSAWQTSVSFLSGLWKGISNTASNIWGGVTGFVKNSSNQSSSNLKSVWNSVSSWWSGVMTQMGTYAHQGWQAVSNVFSSAWGMISGALSGIWSNIAGWFNNLAGQAVSWGSNIIQGFINGITSMLGKVGNAVSQVAGKVAGFLGFHSPSKEGPGRELMTWGPGLVQGFSQGILNSIPMLQTALGQLMLPVVQSLTSPMTAPMATGFNANPGTLASQLNFTQAPTEIYRSKLAPHETKAQKQKTAQTLAAEWKVVDAELKAIQVRGSAQLKNDRATYAAEIKAIQEHDKHLKGNAKKAGEEEIKMLRAQEKARLANERSTLAAKLKAARAQEKQIKQEIKLELHVHANKVDAAEMDKIAIYTVKHYADQIRSQFGNL